ncbi:MAG: hypothetical protein ACRED5_15285 [Propylenella sp.]
MSDKPQFTRITLLAACDLLDRSMDTHAAFGSFILELGAEGNVPTAKTAGYLSEKWQLLKEYLLANRSARAPDGKLMWDVLVGRAAKLWSARRDEKFTQALARDSFLIDDNGELRRMMPEIADIPAADDEVHVLSQQLGLAVALGHLDNAIDLHSAGKWEPANGELRKVLENVFDEAAMKLDPGRASAARTSNERRQLLATLKPPFFIEELGEWSTDGKNFVNGVFKRLHPGAHPGMSENEDCTFRLHLVLVVLRLFLRRLKGRLSS